MVQWKVQYVVYVEMWWYSRKSSRLCMCFVDLEKAFDRVPRKVLECVIRKKGIPEVLVRLVMSLYDGAKTRVTVGSELSEEFVFNVVIHQGSVLSPFLFAFGVDVFDLAREGVLSEWLYADLVLISGLIENLNE